jgi:hypothetical protein
MAKNSKRREWTKDDVRALKSSAREKTPAAKIAKSLKRTLRATQQKAYSIGVTTRTACRGASHLTWSNAMLGHPAQPDVRSLCVRSSEHWKRSRNPSARDDGCRGVIPWRRARATPRRMRAVQAV